MQLAYRPSHQAVPQRPYQDALRWLDDHGIEACAGDGSKTIKFLPPEAVRVHFNESRLQTILSTIYPNNFDYCGQLAKRIVAHPAVLVFCVLLRLQKLQFIESFLRHDNLSDAHLPVPREGDDGFPRQGIDRKAFYDMQQAFSTPRFRADMESEWPSERVLPVSKKELLVHANSAKIFMVEIHPEFDQLGGQHEPDEPHLYVQKTFFGRRANEFCDAEKKGYRETAAAGGVAVQSLLGFFGYFKYNGEHNILLEYADKGNLEDFMRTATEGRPRRPGDILDFWDRLFNLNQVIYRLHSKHGWHQDITTRNILVKSLPLDSIYSFALKLADFGRSHFQNAGLGDNSASEDRDTYGTKEYEGAPDCWRDGAFIRMSRLPVPQTVDIWSLGCIWLEAAVWIVEGWSGLEAFRTRRRDELAKLPVEQTRCFHDGTSMLDCVYDEIRAIRKKTTDQDPITKDVCEQLIKGMLCSKNERRPTALKIWESSQALLKDSRKRIRLSRASWDPSRPNIELLRNQTVPPAMGSTPREPVASSSVLSLTDDHAVHPSGRIQRTTEPPSFGSNNPFRRPYRPASAPVEVTPEQPMLADVIATQSPTGSVSDDRASDPVRDSSRPIHSMPNSGQRNLNMTTARLANVHFNHDSGYGTIHEAGPSTQYGARQWNPFGPTTSVKRAQDPVALPDNLILKAEPSQIMNPPAYSKGVIPTLSTQTAVSFIQERRENNSDAFLPFGSKLLPKLSARDHVFILDNSNSTYLFWKDICGTLGILAPLVVDRDPDGVEVHFTNPMDSGKRSKDANELFNHALKTKARGHTDAEQSLRDILGPYQDKLRDTFALIQAGRHPPSVRPLSIYFLTNGAWEGGGQPEALFLEVAETLKSCRLPREQIGVQFISFGNHTAGLNTLDLLDRMGGKKGFDVGIDTIDTERFDGNVWKMLLGAIDAMFDDDDD